MKLFIGILFSCLFVLASSLSYGQNNVLNENLQPEPSHSVTLSVANLGTSLAKGNQESMEQMLNSYPALQIQSIVTDINGHLHITHTGPQNLGDRIIYLIKEFGGTVTVL